MYFCVYQLKFESLQLHICSYNIDRMHFEKNKSRKNSQFFLSFPGTSASTFSYSYFSLARHSIKKLRLVKILKLILVFILEQIVSYLGVNILEVFY